MWLLLPQLGEGVCWEGEGEDVWKDDLRERIETSVLDERTVDLETFSEVLEEKGVTVTKGKRDFEYAFTDAKEKERKSTARKLGEDFKEGNIRFFTGQYKER